jgi:hypothetical protein
MAFKSIVAVEPIFEHLNSKASSATTKNHVPVRAGTTSYFAESSPVTTITQRDQAVI